MLGMTHISIPPPTGHIVTKLDHVCGDFKDTFDWLSLPLAYRKKINVPLALGDT